MAVVGEREDKNSLSLAVRFRRWRKTFFTHVQWCGFWFALWDEIGHIKPFYSLNRAWWWLKYRTVRRHHVIKIRSLEPGWTSENDRFLHASFQMLEDYLAVRDSTWDSQPQVEQDLHDLLDWWKNRFPVINENDPIKELKLLTRRSPSPFLDSVVASVDKDGDPTAYKCEFKHTSEEDDIFERHRKFVEDVEKEITEKLVKLASLREYICS